MAVRRSRSRSRGRGDGGNSLIELALTLPFLVLLAFGGAEMGMAWVAHNRVEGAAAQAARVGSAGGGSVEADRDVLVALRASLPPGELARLDRVVIYKPSDAAGAVPPGCIKPVGDPSEVGTTACNTYTGTTVRAVTTGSMLGFGGGSTAKDKYWKPVTRNDALIDPPDYIGVWLRTTHESLTHVSFFQLSVTAGSVYRIQPDLAG
jgi:hypothetical protein